MRFILELLRFGRSRLRNYERWNGVMVCNGSLKARTLEESLIAVTYLKPKGWTQVRGSPESFRSSKSAVVHFLSMDRTHKILPFLYYSLLWCPQKTRPSIL